MSKQDIWPDGTLGIYLITRNEPHPAYDVAFGFVIAAIDEESARTMIADQEKFGDEGDGPWLDSRRSTGSAYWEGLSELLDAQGRPVGRGYLEMTGYAGALRLTG